MADVATARVFARAALAGNPSDGYGGRVLAVCIRDFWAQATATLADTVEFGEPRDLLQAAARRLESAGVALPGGYTLRVETTIPREVGLGGSSAIVLAAMRALLELSEAESPDDALAQLALEAETHELGIQAGLQDRIVQARGGLVSMDFASGEHRDLDPALLPPMFLAWCTHAAEHSGVIHGDLRSRFERSEPGVVGAMSRLAALAGRAHAAVLARDAAALGHAIDASFDERAAILNLDPRHVAMVRAARANGASANYAGSGGAIVGLLGGSADRFGDLQDALCAVGATTVRPTVTNVLFSPDLKSRPSILWMVRARATLGSLWRPRRAAITALVMLGFGWALIMQSVGWAQTSYYAFVKALGAGTTTIDAYQWETRDKSYINGHFYSVKAPGLPLLLTPAYLALKAVGGPHLAREGADNARKAGATLWTYRGLNVHNYGGSPKRAALIKRRLEVQAPMVWALGLLGSVAPALLLLLLLRRRLEEIEPGFGTISAITLGTSTLVMPFAVQLFSHVLAALLTFGAFLVAWRERERLPRLRLLTLAGFLAGLAVFTEYPLAIAGAIIGVYAVWRPGARGAGLRTLAARAGAYTAGVVAGVVPLLIYNLQAFGSITKLSYSDAVNVQGTTGHETLGLNSSGFFGIMAPRLRQAAELLISPRGLFVITPVVLAAGAGTWLMYRRGRRAEALVVAAIAASYYLYDTGYWLPMGGGSPGPRFLIPMLPFLALGLASAWRRFPAVTLALAVPSAVTMIAATISYPLIGAGGTHQWTQRIGVGNFQHTLPTIFGMNNGWLAISPVLLAFAGAALFAARTVPRLRVSRAQIRASWAALAAWGLLAGVISPALGEEQIGGPLAAPTGFIDHRAHPALVIAGLIAAALALSVLMLRSRQPVDDEGPDDGTLEAEPGHRAPPPLRPRRVGDVVGVEYYGAHADAPQPAD